MKSVHLELAPGSQAIYLKIASSLRDAVRAGRIAPGESLPSSRQLASRLGVNRHTVRAALEELVAEGWLEPQERIGYFVAADLPMVRPLIVAKDNPLMGLINSRYASKDTKRTRVGASIRAARYNLESSMPDLRLLPARELRSCFQASMKMLSNHLDYDGVQGEPVLHDAVSTLLRQQRGLGDREIVITQGSQEAIYMVAQLFLRPGSHVVTEDPGYQPAWECFRYAGANLCHVPVDGEGMDSVRLEEEISKRRIDLIYLTPMHQYPTTVTLTPARRARIYALARRHRIPILEDDYDHDVHFDSFPPLPMAACDPDGLVIYISTLSKLIFPGARIGFLAVPEAILPAFLQIKKHTSRTNETLSGRAIGLWMRDGGFERHVRRLTRVYHQRRDHVVAALEDSSFFRNHCTFFVPKGGMNLWLDTRRSSVRVCEAAARKGLLLSGEHLYKSHPSHRSTHLRLGFTAHEETEMIKALQLLERAIKSAD